jgi:hypothetical protein
MKNIKQTASKLENYGRNGDTILAHITPAEAQLLQRLGGSGTINPKTGLPEFFLSAIAGPILSVAGGLISGGKTADAAKGQAEALRAAADKAAGMAAFKPVGMTTAFGTSTFPEEGAAGYTLSPELKAVQDRLFTATGTYDPTAAGTAAAPLMSGASSLFELGGELLPTDTSRVGSSESQALADRFAAASAGLMPTSYDTGASAGATAFSNRLNTLAGQVTPTSYDPTAAAQQYYQQQQELLQPGRAAQLAETRASLFGSGRTGLGVNTGTGGGPSNPELQAYYNSLARADRELAAESTDIARKRLRDDIALGTDLEERGLSTLTDSEKRNRDAMLRELDLSLGYGTGGLDVRETGTDIARSRFGEDVRLGTGLLGTGGELISSASSITAGGYAPTEAQLRLIRETESMGQDPYRLSLDLADRRASAGARQGELYLDPQRAAADAYSQYQGYSPAGTFLSGVGSTMSGGGFSNLLSSGGGNKPRYSGPSYGSNSSFDNSWFDTMSYD